MQREFILSPSGTPCNPPPWGTLTAIDLATGERRWERPLGSIKALADTPGSDQWGSLNLGGVMSTGTGLVFASGGFDEKIHAFSAETGRLLWSADLPAGGNASPMTYRIRGRQFVVISAGGHDRMGTSAGDYVVAFALPSAADALPVPQSTLSLAGRYEGQLLVGDGRYPIVLTLRDGATSVVEGEMTGSLVGTITGHMEDETLAYDVPFRLAAEGCTGRLRVDAERANRGRMLVGPALLSGECSDGTEEIGVAAVRRIDP
jgi:outer membrane protein assembly factor BamB